MNSIKRVGIVVIVFLFLFLMSESFIVESINDRGILVGIGLDHDGTDYLLTCEMLTGSSPDSGEGGFSKLICGKGKTVSLALQNVYTLTGRQPSLGLCSIIVLGKSLYSTMSIKECLTFFSLSDAFRDGSMVVCARSFAREILSTASPLNQSPSFALSEIIQKSSKNITIPENNLQQFMNSQITLSQGGFLNMVSVKDSSISNDLDDQSQDNITQGTFLIQEAAIFKDFNYVDVLSKDEVYGYCMLKEKNVYQSFLVEENNPQTLELLPEKAALSVANKKLKTDVIWENNKPTIKVEIELKLKRSLSDNNEKLSKLMPRDDNQITKEMLKQAEQQCQEMLAQVVEKSIQTNCDFCQISYDFYKKYGYKWSNFVLENPDFLLNNLEISTQIKCRQ